MYGMEKVPCGTCGSLKYYIWQKVGEVESCNECARIVDNTPRDAIGQKIHIPPEHLGKFSYAVGEVVNSARQYSDVLKKANLGLRKG